MSDMEIGCDFTQDYVPSDEGPETVVLVHLQNCPECQEQTAVLDEGTADWSISA